jgi:hypothetical protein
VRAVRGRARLALSRRTAVPAVAALACALALGACGDSKDGRTSAERPPTLPANFNLQLYTCADWQRSDEPTRRYVIRRLREVTSGEVSGTGVRGRGTILPDDQARDLFGNYCRQRFARGFVLYKVYGQAAGFAGGTP